MGACMSSDGMASTEQEKVLHRLAEKAMKEAKGHLDSQAKLLLLGSGDSGKTTILKQMRLIHNLTFSNDEIETYRQLAFDNIVRGMKLVLDAMSDMDIKVSEENMEHAEFVWSCILELDGGQGFPRSYYLPLKALWSDPGVQRAWERGNEAALPENLSYFYSSLDRLFEPSYRPTMQDIVHCRVRTTGINELLFRINDQRELLLVDVGGQRSERRKWIHCFQGVTGILFVASLSGYDQCLVEDKSANQMQDALTIWHSICHSIWFKETKLILFLNKNDLFEEKVPHSSVRKCFPDFDGDPSDIKAVRDYFKKRFLALGRGAGIHRDIYTHVTTATNTALLKTIMLAVQDIILRDNLQKLSLL